MSVLSHVVLGGGNLGLVLDPETEDLNAASFVPLRDFET